jgi:hypothetical protein
MRTRREQEFAKLTEDKCDSGREIQPLTRPFESSCFFRLFVQPGIHVGQFAFTFRPQLRF